MPAGTDAGVMDAKGAVATHVCTSKSSATNFAADAPKVLHQILCLWNFMVFPKTQRAEGDLCIPIFDLLQDHLCRCRCEHNAMSKMANVKPQVFKGRGSDSWEVVS